MGSEISPGKRDKLAVFLYALAIKLNDDGAQTLCLRAEPIQAAVETDLIQNLLQKVQIVGKQG